jgi:hypothetical protein
VAELKLERSLPDFRVAMSSANGSITIELSGTADLQAKPAIDATLAELQKASRELHTRAVSVDFTKLEFMNSSCFKSFVTWINSTASLAEDARYQIEFLSNPTLHWQKRSLHALVQFAPELVTVRS